MTEADPKKEQILKLANDWGIDIYNVVREDTDAS